MSARGCKSQCLQAFEVKNQEFTFDIIDMSSLSCGFNGALNLVEIDADGSLAKYSTGAKYGTRLL